MLTAVQSGACFHHLIGFTLDPAVLASFYPAREWPHEERSLNLWGRGILRA
jgi:hypothetical protein